MLFGAQVRQAGERIGRPPRPQGLPAVLEVPGTDEHGPDARELRAVRRLHAEHLRLRASGAR